MAKDKITEYDSNAANNTVVGDVNLAENSALPSDMNNAVREVMSHLKAFSDGTDAITGLTVDGNIKLDGNYPTGTNNVALGNTALDDGSLSGANNTAIGSAAMTAHTSGNNNTAVGYAALTTNTTGAGNNAFGYSALFSNTTGSNNTSVGTNALDNNTTASDNTAVGYQSLGANTTGENNVAIGVSALLNNSTASKNVAVGRQALQDNTTGGGNIGVGDRAGENITTGLYNTCVGTESGASATTASDNTFIGRFAGNSVTGGDNTCVGKNAGYAISTGSKNTILGQYNGNQDGLDIRTSSNNIVLSDGDGNARAFYYQDYNQWSIKGGRDGFFATVIEHTTTGSAPYGLKVSYTASAPDNHSGQFITCTDSSTVRFRVYNDGDTQNHDNSYGGISDQKLKEQIADASSQWDDIKALTVRKFKFKTDVAAADTDNDSLYRLGVIAQEVETAGMSGLVNESPDIDADGNDLGTVTKGVKYSILYMKAVKALQEAMTRIETLEAKVAALEAE